MKSVVELLVGIFRATLIYRLLSIYASKLGHEFAELVHVLNLGQDIRSVNGLRCVGASVTACGLYGGTAPGGA